MSDELKTHIIHLLQDFLTLEIGKSIIQLKQLITPLCKTKL
jgi:hypothetical protein